MADSIKIASVAIVGTVDVFFVGIADVIKVACVNDDAETACIRVARVVCGRILDVCCAKGEERVGRKTRDELRDDILVTDICDTHAVGQDESWISGSDLMSAVNGTNDIRVLIVLNRKG